MSSKSLSPIYKRVVKKVLTETLQVKKGDALTVETWNNGLDFARLVVSEARAMGCTATTIFEDEEAYVEGVRRAPKDMIGTMGRNEYGLLAATDAYVFIPGPTLASYSRSLTASELANSTRYNSSWYDAARKAKLKGARLAFGYIGKDLARMLGMSIEEAVRGQLQGVLTDFGGISRRAAAVGRRLSDDSEVRVDSGGATLRFTLRGELEIQDGVVDDKDIAEGNNVAYVPPGFVAKDLDSGSVEGKLKVSPTLTKYGILNDAELEFKGGRLTGWKSSDRARLAKLMDPIPEERRKLTFMEIGVNPAFKYGLAQDRFVSGALNFGGLGFRALVKGASVSVGGSQVLRHGTLGP